MTMFSGYGALASLEPQKDSMGEVHEMDDIKRPGD